MSIYYVRHGKTDWNLTGRFQGQSDIELNDVGRLQAKQLQDSLKDMKIDKIYCSPLKRTIETAQIINEALQVEIILVDALKERGFGALEGHQVDFDINLWDPNNQIPVEDCEALDDFFKRIYDFLESIEEESKNKNILIVAHGGVSLACIKYYRGFEDESNLKQYIVKNCVIEKFRD